MNKERKIADKNHNAFIANGVEKHQQTSIAPISIVERHDEVTLKNINKKYLEILEFCRKHIGEPFFASDGFIFYNCDCVKALDELRNQNFRIDLTITSPPYNIGKEYENKMDVSSYVDWCSKWMNYIYYLTKDDGAFWLNVGYLDVPEKGLCVPIPYLIWDKSQFYLLQEIVWKYGAGVSSSRRLSPRNEKWLFYVKNPEQYTFNLDDIRDPNVKYPNQKKNGKYRCNPLGKNPSDVWEFPKVTTGKSRSSKERTEHPAQFPLGIVERVARASSNVAEIILDPFAGSCSTGIAAVGLGRVFLGFEINTNYCQMAVKRFIEFNQLRKNQQHSLF